MQKCLVFLVGAEANVLANPFWRITVDQAVNDLLNVVVDKVVAKLNAERELVTQAVKSTDNVFSSLIQKTFSVADNVLADGAHVDLLVPKADIADPPYQCCDWIGQCH